jgi:hypothetical protein
VHQPDDDAESDDVANSNTFVVLLDDGNAPCEF